MTKWKSEILLEELNRKAEEIYAKKVELNKLRDEFLEIKKKSLEQLLIDYELTGDIWYQDKNIYNNKSEWKPGKLMIEKDSLGFGICVHLYTTKEKLRKRPSFTYYNSEDFLLDYLEGKKMRKMYGGEAYGKRKTY